MEGVKNSRNGSVLGMDLMSRNGSVLNMDLMTGPVEDPEAGWCGS